MKRIHGITLLIIGLINFAGFGLSANAAESLPPGLVIADEKGIHAQSDGKYFIEHNGIEPGLTFEKNVTISNYGIDNQSYRLSLRFSEGDEKHPILKKGKVDLNKAITIKMTMRGKNLYSGDLTGKGLLKSGTTSVDLGSFKPGETENLKINFSVRDNDKDDWSNKSQSDSYWIFHAVEDTKVEPPKKIIKPFGRLPQTGYDMRNVLLGFILGLLLISLVIVVTIKRSKRKRR